jgi:uncharacterized protein (DUF1810 family)
MSDPYDLRRFVETQATIYDGALAELRNGRKASHWIWFIFPQIAGLGMSAMSQHYSISCLDEARAYLGHPVLGPRLIECIQAMNAVDGRSAYEVLGPPDDLKFRSSLTLFAAAAPDNPVFAEALAKYFAGEPDPLTLEKLAALGA